MVEFFESQITVEGKSRKESYEIMVTETYNDFMAIPNKIPIKDQRLFISSLNTSTINEL
jgi:hypothetical protein